VTAEYVIGRAPRDRHDHRVLLRPGVVAGAVAEAMCTLTVVVLNNGDALYAWDAVDPGEKACPKCARSEAPPIARIAAQAPPGSIATPPHRPPHRPRP
jgi:hypothetical protein